MIFLTIMTKMVACSGILYAYYWLFLRNKRFHHYNRFYLLAITGLSVTVPFIKIPIEFESHTTTGQLANRSIEIISVNRWENDLADSSAASNWNSWFTAQDLIIMSYSLVVIVLLYILCRSIRNIQKISRKYPFEFINTLKFYNTSEPGTPFSFFRSIFWNRNLDIDSREGQQIFKHELFHVKQQHSADILFMEGVSIFFWINPIFYLIKKEVKAIHEFLADQHAASGNKEQDYAELLVLQSISMKKSPISNHFFQNHIKRRIAMITQFKTKKYSYWTRLFVLPLSVLLFCAIALYAKAPVKTKIDKGGENPAPIIVLVDAGHGGNDAGARGNNGVQEKDLSLSIAKQLQLQAKNYNVNVVMTRNEDNYPSLRERSTLARQINADVIISIHIGGAPQESVKTGFDIYVTNRNHLTVTKSKLLGDNIAKELKNTYEVGPLKQRTEAGIWILDSVHCPAVLIECGYITSDKDVEFISRTENQVAIAKNILQGIVRYQSGNITENTADTIPKTKRFNAKVEEKMTARQSDEEDARRKDAHLRELKAQHQELEKKHKEMEIKQRELSELDMEIKQKQEQLVRERNERDIQRQKVAESRMSEVRLKHEELVEKQNERDIQRRKINEARVTELQRNNNILLEKQLQMSQEQDVNLQKEKEAVLRSRQDLERLQQKLEEEKEIDLQTEQRTLVQKQLELELAIKNSTLDNIRNMERKEKAVMQEQRQREMNKRENRLQSGNINTDSSEEPERLFTRVEKSARYPGGKDGWMDYLNKNLRYPDEAREKGISGTVVLKFVVDKLGKLSDITVVSGPAELRNESLRLIRQSGDWTPAQQNGNAVTAAHQEAIVFKPAK